MNKTWAEPSHVGKVTISILDIFAREFHKESCKDQIDHSLLIKLGGACGYQAQLYSGLQKNHEFAKRLQRIEIQVQNADAESLAMINNPVISAEEDRQSRLDGR